MLRTHTCGDLRADDIGTHVTLTGWVNRRRDHGGLVFVNLRDRYGLTQVVCDSEHASDVFDAARELGSEWVIAIEGKVRARPDGQANPDMQTGAIEVLADTLRVLNPSKTPPIEVAREVELDEVNRLRYRYLYLRRERMQANIALRHKAMTHVRRFHNERGFIEVETPIIIKATPEGARDFLVPSRMQPGRFYALPQSPQQLKQLLMVAGFDRYYQIARCFRDEDPRADRELEFTQLDMEMAFVDEQDVMALTEELLIGLAGALTPHLEIRGVPFPMMTYHDAIERYGTDKPDLRFGLELLDIGPDVADSEFRVFSSTIAGGGRVKAIAAPTTYTRREIDGLERVAKEIGAAGLAWLSFEDGAVRGPIAKFLSGAEIDALRDRPGLEEPFTLLIVAGDGALVAKVHDRLRAEVARSLDMIPANELRFVWIVDPPLVEWDDDAERWMAAHHMFTAPQERDIELLGSSPGSVRARAYDIVCNGFELGSGSIRIHDREEQRRVFALLELSDEEAEEQFGHMLTAFEYGAPPHGGIAWGIDRVVAILAGETNIREVIAFPKSLSGVDPMTGSPSRVPEESLDVLGIRIVAEPDAERAPDPDATPEPALGSAQDS
jgi:aspartyl-tRNA synthetase